jgi:outer membrane receptor for ferrienterochelin and colicins
MNRWFFNTSYTTKSKWNFDLTLNWVGEKRLPSTVNNPIALQLSPYSESFVLVNAQVSKSFKKRVDVYVGCENILDFKQTNPILDSKNPFGGNFDASMIWGPVFGRMFYTGFRWKL